jgi:hypothetical protein
MVYIKSWQLKLNEIIPYSKDIWNFCYQSDFSYSFMAYSSITNSTEIRVMKKQHLFVGI